MNVVGIAAEYNPFHAGHLYQIERARDFVSADAVVAVMSGNFVQRGEPAIKDKWTRTAWALDNGVDVVLEIPTYFCLSAASAYSFATVDMLESFGVVTHISFGSESGDVDVLRRIAERTKTRRAELEEETSKYTALGESYPRAFSHAYSEIFGDDEETVKETEILSNPNDILALEYIKNLRTLEPVAIKRAGAGYNDEVIPGERFQSATGIRKGLIQGEDVSGYIPKSVVLTADDAGRFETADDELFDLVRYAVLRGEASSMEEAPAAGEGLSNILKREIRYADSLSDLKDRLKSKRYTATRISRMLMQIALGIDRRDFYGAVPEYIRVLGFTERGRSLIREAKKKGDPSKPIITNINREAGNGNESENFRKLLELDILATDIHNAVMHRDMGKYNDMVMSPVMR